MVWGEAHWVAGGVKDFDSGVGLVGKKDGNGCGRPVHCCGAGLLFFE